MTGGARRIGIFGGTFDPVHTGHVVVATHVRAALDLDEVLVVVAGDPWQKRGDVVASAADRYALVEAAFAEVEGVTPSPVELTRPGPTYTADTLAALAGPDRRLHLVVGADVVRRLDSWVRLEVVRELATLVVVGRAGDDRPAPPGPGWSVVPVEIPRLDISSTDLRARIARGAPIDGLVPPAVVREIRARRLYDQAR